MLSITHIFDISRGYLSKYIRLVIVPIIGQCLIRHGIHIRRMVGRDIMILNNMQLSIRYRSKTGEIRGRPLGRLSDLFLVLQDKTMQ
jgi:hypothetical protein